MRILLIIILAFLLNGCPFASDYFYLNRLDENRQTVVGIRLNEWNKVKQLNQNSFLIKSGGKVAIGAEIVPKKDIINQAEKNKVLDFLDLNAAEELQIYKKQHIFDLGLKKLNQTPLHIYSRTSPEWASSDNYGIEIRIDSENIAFFEDGIMLKESTIDFSVGETKRLIVVNKGKFIKVSLDCDDILIWKTDKPISEYLLFESVGSGNWEINAVKVENNIPDGIFRNREPIK